MYNVPSITPEQLHTELQGPNPPLLIDVRESDELEISRLDPITHIPLGDIPARLAELDRDADIVVVCRSGGRSGQAVAYMLQSGFMRVRNLTSGMNGWAQTVDPSLPVY